MDTQLPSGVILGSRAWSAFGFLLTSVPAGIALWAGVYGYAYGHGVTRELVMAALGLLLLMPALDALVRTIRPNCFLLDDDGFSLRTWMSTRRWSWGEYRGLWGLTLQLLRVASEDGRVRNVSVGNWARDVEHRFYAFASSRGASITEPPPLRPSTTPMFFVFGALLALALAVAVKG